MSNTHEIVCLDCKLKLWWGQVSSRGINTYHYVDEKGNSLLGRFLFEHLGHALLVTDEHSDHVEAEYVDWPQHGPDTSELEGRTK